MNNFSVDLHGVVELLSNHLYSGPHVYLRELPQNGIDAITEAVDLAAHFDARKGNSYKSSLLAADMADLGGAPGR